MLILSLVSSFIYCYAECHYAECHHARIKGMVTFLTKVSSAEMPATV